MRGSASPSPQAFGRRRAAPTRAVVVLARGDRTRHFDLGSLHLGAAAFAAIALVVSLCAFATYFFLQDNLLEATIARSHEMQQRYEARIAALRSKVDLATSRQLLDQHAISQRLEALAARQRELGTKAVVFREALDRAGKARIALPKLNLDRETSNAGKKPLKLGGLIGTSTPFATASSRSFAALDIPEDGSTVAMIGSLEQTLARTERKQLESLKAIREKTRDKSRRLASILKRQGIRVPEDTAIGGPLIEDPTAAGFDHSVEALKASLETLAKVRKAARSLPHGSPTKTARISSRFGSRRDPFTGRRALHGGLDFRAPRGTPVAATASGRVLRAGRNGGYGKFVEIDHGGGITTRYAHLHRIKVRKGARIKKGAIIGTVGSTGRSTGPHLHYEVRRKGKPLDPIHYVRLEKKLRPFL